MTERVHPLAEILPMLPEEELAALAESIAEAGLRHPILTSEVPDPETGELVEMIIDGRNRLAACRLAGIEPRFEQLNGVDVGSLILAENVDRRNLNAGQRAMARAKLMPEGKPGTRTDLSRNRERLEKAEANAVSQARFVLRHDPVLASSVMSGAESLNAAYEVTRERVAIAQGESLIPRYDAMITAIAECAKIDIGNCDDLHFLLKVAGNLEPERGASSVRLRAEQGIGKVLKELAQIEKRP